MRSLVFIVSLGLMFAGCASNKNIEVTSIRTRPIELQVEVVSAREEFESAPNRYFIALRVLEPKENQVPTIHLVLDDVYEAQRAFTKSGSRWKIRCDEEAFDHERAIGFSFWTMSDISPEPLKSPNQALLPTPMSVTSPACAGLAPAIVAADL